MPVLPSGLKTKRRGARLSAPPKTENMEIKSFKDLNLSPEILKAVEASGYEKPSPIQAQAIPEILAGRDIFGCAQTGTGKTAAFTLPIIQKLSDNMKFVGGGEFRALVLVPTRELAEQVAENVASYGKFTELKSCKIYGGVSQGAQIRALSKGVDILIATPGRLLDLFRQKELGFGGVEFLVLDEADRMLDMGFIHDIRTICSKLPKERQSLLFSATLAPEVEALASSIVRDPKKISIAPESPTVEKIDQKLYFTSNDDKISLLKHVIECKLAKEPDSLALVFCRTKHGANKVANRLASKTFNAGVIHGNKSQSSRKNALERFKGRESRVLVATDIAARGIDVKAMSLVINYDLPEEPETYVHRIGRTARAEAEGEAVSFCTLEEVGLLRGIERYIRREIPYADDNPFHSQAVQDLKESNKKIPFKRQRGNSGSGRPDASFASRGRGDGDANRRGNSGRKPKADSEGYGLSERGKPRGKSARVSAGGEKQGRGRRPAKGAPAREAAEEPRAAPKPKGLVGWLFSKRKG